MTDGHLYEFRAGGTRWLPLAPRGDDIGDGPQDAAKALLLGVLSYVGGKTIKYLYDFGDG